MTIQLVWPKGRLSIVLADTDWARSLLRVMPVNSTAQLWGQEVYFSVPVAASLNANARQVVEPGSVCFWVEGKCLAIPFGPTPISQNGECRLVTKVNVVGKAAGDLGSLGTIQAGDGIQLVAAEA